MLSSSRTDLYAHVLSLFVRLNVHKTFDLNLSQLLDFLIDVQDKYTDAPYHTFYHAADIVTMLYYLCHDLNADMYLTESDKSILMVAALCHDIGHVSNKPFALVHVVETKAHFYINLYSQDSPILFRSTQERNWRKNMARNRHLKPIRCILQWNY